MKNLLSTFLLFALLQSAYIFSESSYGASACCKQGANPSKSVFLDTYDVFSVASPLTWFSRDVLLEEGCPAITFMPFAFSGTSRGSRQVARRFGIAGNGICTDGIHISNKMDPNAAAYGLLGPGADVQAIHLNINTTGDEFRSTVFFMPETSFWGVHAACFLPVYCFESGDLWVSVSLPIGIRKNRMNVHETGVSESVQAASGERGLDGAPFVASATDAFCQSNWRFGKINGCASAPSFLDASGVGDIECTLGYSSSLCEGIQAHLFGGAVLPGDSSQTAEWVYQPLLGNGGHTGLFAGAGCSCPVLDNEYVGCTVHAAADAQYFFSRQQYRSFDLQGKPWSRYMGFFASQDQAASYSTASGGGVSGVNHCTRCVKILPGVVAHTMLALEFAAERGNFVFGLQGVHSGGERLIVPCSFDGAIKSSMVNNAKRLSAARTIRDTFFEADLPLDRWDSVSIGVNAVDWQSGLMEPSFDVGAFFMMRHTGHMRDRPVNCMAGLLLDGLFGNRASEKWGFVCSLSVGW